MSMHPHALPAIPEETVRVARAAFPHSNIYLTMRDQLGTLYEDENFAVLFPKRGRPAEAPWQLALVCVFQFVEGLSDRQAAEAVRSRIDWRYVLSGSALRKELWSRRVDKRGTVFPCEGFEETQVSVQLRYRQSFWRESGQLHRYILAETKKTYSRHRLVAQSGMLSLHKKRIRYNCAALIHFAAPRLLP